MSKRGIAGLIVVGALLLPLLGAVGYGAVTKWLLPEPPDECDLVSIPEVRQILAGADVDVVARSASPGNKTFGWSYSCTYRSRTGEVDVNELRVSVVTGVRSTGRIGVMDGKQLTGLGAEAWAGPGSGVLRTGNIQVQVDFRGLGHDHNAHDVPEQALRKLAGRLSTVPEFPAAEVSGVCDRLDVAAAEEALGAELPGRRAAIRPNGEVSCVFAGASARFEVKVQSNTDPTRPDGKRILGGDVSVRGLPAKAMEDRLGSGDKIYFTIDDRMYMVGLSSERGKPPQETDIPRQLVEAVEDCGGDLAGC